ncbi:MAG: globin domain-containing protein [Verrucomicrobiota bacterium]
MLPCGVLAAEQTLRLRKSFAIVERQSHVAALVFYQKLFELDPALRPLFKNDIEAQARKLIEMLAAALSLLEKPEQLISTLEALGARHVGYGVQIEHYDTVEVALISMLESTQKNDFTPELRADWLQLYGLIRETMLRGAELRRPKS